MGLRAGRARITPHPEQVITRPAATFALHACPHHVSGQCSSSIPQDHGETTAVWTGAHWWVGAARVVICGPTVRILLAMGCNSSKPKPDGDAATTSGHGTPATSPKPTSRPPHTSATAAPVGTAFNPGRWRRTQQVAGKTGDRPACIHTQAGSHRLGQARLGQATSVVHYFGRRLDGVAQRGDGRAR